MATLAQLREIIRSILREPAPARWQNSDLDRYINGCVLEIARTMERRKSAAIDVAANTPYVQPPTDCLVPDELFWLKTGETEKRELYPATSTMPPDVASGTPTYYYLLEDRIYLYPVPDSSGVLYLTYFWRPASLVNDNDTLAVEDTDQLIINYAVWRAYLEDGDPMAQLWEAEFAKELARWATIEQARHSMAFRPKAEW